MVNDLKNSVHFNATPNGEINMSVQSWKIGDVKVTKILESEGPSPYPMIPEATPEAVLPMKWLPPGLLTENGDLILSFHALLVETSELKIV